MPLSLMHDQYDARPTASVTFPAIADIQIMLLGD